MANRRTLAVLALVILLINTACSTSPASQKAAPPPELKSTDSLWAQALPTGFREQLPNLFANAPIYQEHLTYDPDQKQLTGTAEIRFTNASERTLPALYMRTYAKVFGPGTDHDFRLTDLKVDGKPADFTMGRTLITVPLPKPLQPGETVHLSFATAVTLPEVQLARSMGTWKAPPTNRDGLVNSGLYGIGPAVTGLLTAPTMLPGGDQGKEIDVAGSDQILPNPPLQLRDVWLTLPKDWVAIAGGATMGVEPTADGRQTVHLVYAGRQGALLVSNSLIRQSAKAGDVTVTAYAARPFEAFGAALLKNAVDGLQAYLPVYGAFPANRLDVVALPLATAGGKFVGDGVAVIAEPMLSGIQSGFPGLADPVLAAWLDNDRPWNLRMSEFHEIAHAWWFDLVQADPAAPWFQEAMAEASTVYALGKADGAAAADKKVNLLKARYMLDRLNGDPDVPFNLAPSRYNSITHQQAIHYGKGGLFFDTVRRQVGDDQFFGALRSYLAQHQFAEVPDPGPVQALIDLPGMRGLVQRWVVETHGDEDIGTLAVHDPAIRRELGLPPEK